jgi:hypothetical protein
MRGTFAVWAAGLLLLVPSPAQAGPMETVRITITRGDLAAPIEIADPTVTKSFQVWAGPGNFRRVGDADVPVIFPQGFVIDWSRGVVEPPEGLTLYQVSFVTSRPIPNTYRVRYIIDPSTNRGYVYIPGKGEAEYADNTWLIFRGVEGKWFCAWSKWEELANRLIANAAKAH